MDERNWLHKIWFRFTMLHIVIIISMWIIYPYFAFQDLRRNVELNCSETSIPTCENDVVHEFVEKFGLAFLVHMIFLVTLPCIYSVMIAATFSYLKDHQRRLPQVIPLQFVNPYNSPVV